MFERILACLCAVAIIGTATAQERELVFAVTEGVTYQATPKEIREKFTPIGEVIAKAVGRRVRTVLVPGYDDLRAGLANQEYDVAFVHPAHVSMAEIKAGRYNAVAWTAGYTDYSVALLIDGKRTLKSIEDLRGRTVVTPDPDSITAAMVRAMLRAARLPMTTAKPAASVDRQDSSVVRLIATRYQDAVPFYIENGFAQVGATAAKSVVKAWTDKGGIVLAQSRSVPIKQLIASTRISVADQDRLRQALVTLASNKPGRDALDVLGYKGFVPTSQDDELKAIVWLGL